MEIITIQKYIHTSPRKVRLVADMVRKMQPTKALQLLDFTPKMAARDVSKAVKTVLANARMQGIEADKLYFKSIEVNEGPKMKRFRAGTRGRAKPYVRKMSHIKIIVTDEVRKPTSVPSGSKNQTSKVKPRDQKVKADLVDKETDVPVVSESIDKTEDKKEKK